MSTHPARTALHMQVWGLALEHGRVNPQHIETSVHKRLSQPLIQRFRLIFEYTLS